MKKLFLVVALILTAASLGASEVLSRMRPEPEGKTDSYVSDNGAYEVAITYHQIFSSWSLREHGRELWMRPFMGETGAATVSDNGATITVSLWGWRDEGVLSGFAVYDRNGELVRKILFTGDHGHEALSWTEVTGISPDGTHIVIGDGGKDTSFVTLYEAKSGQVVWTTNAGFPRMLAIRVKENGLFTLVATCRDDNQDMEFTLLDQHGKQLWSVRKADNFANEAKPYVRFDADGRDVAIYDVKTQRYEHLPILRKPD